MNSFDILQHVVAELHRRRGSLRHIARETGVSYDTLIRMRNGEGSPTYDNVKKVHDYLFGVIKAATAEVSA